MGVSDMKIIYKNGNKVEGRIDHKTPVKKNLTLSEMVEVASAELKLMHEERANNVHKSKVVFRYPPELRTKRTSENLAEEMAVGMRLQSCNPQTETEPLIFYGTKNGPDPDLLGLTGTNPFTDNQWAAWHESDKRQLLLQCPCVTEVVIENLAHESAACYEYHATSLNVLCYELKSVITALLGVK